MNCFLGKQERIEHSTQGKFNTIGNSGRIKPLWQIQTLNDHRNTFGEIKLYEFCLSEHNALSRNTFEAFGVRQKYDMIITLFSQYKYIFAGSQVTL